ncbi:MAG: type III pantothenate kinase [bacterium]|nr:type III pantothenate kinase [bacterium]
MASRIVIDAGNSQVKISALKQEAAYCKFGPKGSEFLLNDLEFQPLGSIPTANVSSDTGNFIDQISRLDAPPSSEKILISVVPSVTEIIRNLWPDILVVGQVSELPCDHEIIHQETMGPDRVCNIAAALGIGLTSAVVVDAGTATTFDLLLDGVFKGGLISPGMEFSSRQMGAKGAMLETFSFGKTPSTVGRHTEEAMKNGAWLAGWGSIEWTLNKLKESYGDLPVILTGGLSSLLPLDDRIVDPAWTLRGAVFLAGLNKQV